MGSRIPCPQHEQLHASHATWQNRKSPKVTEFKEFNRYHHFSLRTPNQYTSHGTKGWILFPCCVTSRQGCWGGELTEGRREQESIYPHSYSNLPWTHQTPAKVRATSPQEAKPDSAHKGGACRASTYLRTARPPRSL